MVDGAVQDSNLSRNETWRCEGGRGRCEFGGELLLVMEQIQRGGGFQLLFKHTQITNLSPNPLKRFHHYAPESKTSITRTSIKDK